MEILVDWGVTQDPSPLYCRLEKFAIEQAMIHGRVAAAHAIRNCITRGDMRGNVDSSGSLINSVLVIWAIFLYDNLMWLGEAAMETWQHLWQKMY